MRVGGEGGGAQSWRCAIRAGLLRRHPSPRPLALQLALFDHSLSGRRWVCFLSRGTLYYSKSKLQGL